MPGLRCARARRRSSRRRPRPLRRVHLDLVRSGPEDERRAEGCADNRIGGSRRGRRRGCRRSSALGSVFGAGFGASAWSVVVGRRRSFVVGAVVVGVVGRRRRATAPSRPERGQPEVRRRRGERRRRFQRPASRSLSTHGAGRRSPFSRSGERASPTREGLLHGLDTDGRACRGAIETGPSSPGRTAALWGNSRRRAARLRRLVRIRHADRRTAAGCAKTGRSLESPDDLAVPKNARSLILRRPLRRPRGRARRVVHGPRETQRRAHAHRSPPGDDGVKEHQRLGADRSSILATRLGAPRAGRRRRTRDRRTRLRDAPPVERIREPAREPRLDVREPAEAGGVEGAHHRSFDETVPANRPAAASS